MLSVDELWKVCSDVAIENGVELFDIEIPRSAVTGVLKVFIWRSNRAGITHDDCSVVSRRLFEIDEARTAAGVIAGGDAGEAEGVAATKSSEPPILADGWSVEVSSPGVNRKLNRPQHFAEAVGERVQVKFGLEKAKGSDSVVGVLRRVEGDEIIVEVEGQKKEVRIPLKGIREARIDFLF